MSKQNALDFLEKGKPDDLAPWIVLVGNEAFLVLEALRHIKALFYGEGEATETRFDDTAQWRDVRDELATRSLFGGGEARMVVVSDADKFVTRHRDALEADVASQRKSGLLVLAVQSWPGNTRLAKAIAEKGLVVECKPPSQGRNTDTKRVQTWLRQRAKSHHHIQLDPEASRLLLELCGLEFGLLDQSLAKLAVWTTEKNVDAELVKTAVGGWSTKTAWDMIDAALSGDTAAALGQWDHLLQAGENPIGVFAQISFTLRRLAAATRFYQEARDEQRPIRLGDALMQAGVRDWPSGNIQNCEKQLLRLGRVRASQLYRWLLETDLALKGSHSTAHRARWCIEDLFLRMADA